MGQMAVNLLAHGRVQGVWFRASAQTEARRLAITGWVRNCSDGTVEIHAEGDQNDLERFISWCRKGPHGADVTQLEVEWVSVKGGKSFEVRH